MINKKNFFSRLFRLRPVSRRQHAFRRALRQLAPVESLEDRRLLAAWDLSATLVSSTQPESQEGYSVAEGSQYHVTGKPFTSVNGFVESGAVEVFDAASNHHIATLSSPLPFSGGRFGHSVAVSGATIVVGALGDAGSVGRAYVYKVDNGSVSLASILENPTPAGGDEFGATVAISNNLIVVGAPRDDTGASNAGSVYVYDQSGGFATLSVTILNPTPAGGDLFGSSVAVDGNTVIVGALLDDTGATNAGSAYVYSLNGASLDSTLNNPNPASGDLFGNSVAISGNTIVVGAYSDDTGASGAGSVYIFDKSSGTAMPYATVHNPAPNSADLFGVSVAISGRTLVIGSHLDDGTASDAGSAYVYQVDAGTVTFLDTIDNPFPAPEDRFGFSVGVSDDTIVVGASQNDGQYANQGAAYVFVRVNTPPTALAVTSSQVAENLPAGTLVGSLSSSDLDLDDTFVYSLVAGGGDADNASFEIVGDTLVTAGSFDFEAQQNYSLRLRTTDQGGLYHEQTIAIHVTNVNDPPAVSRAISVTTTEDDTNFSVDLLAGASDPDIGDTLSVENIVLIAGDSSGVIVNGTSLNVSPAAYNSLTATASEVITYSFDIVDENGGVAQQSATITIIGFNDTPVANNDDAVVNEDSVLVIDVLANDTDIDTNSGGAHGAPGTLDTTFGVGGLATLDISIPSNQIARSVLVQPDGKYIVAGTSDGVFTYSDFAISRFNADGSLDSTFGDGGFVTAPLSGANNSHGLARQSDGKILVAGNVYDSGDSDFAVLRYNLDGSIDNSFGDNGLVVTDFGSTAHPGDVAYAISVDANDNLVVVGSSNQGGASSGLDFAIARYVTADGSLDSSFGTGGKIVFGGGGADEASAVEILADGRLVVVGTSTNEVTFQTDIAILCYLPNGSLDTSFGSGGISLTDTGNTPSNVRLAIDELTSEIVVAATVQSRFMVLRFNPDGSPATGPVHLPRLSELSDTLTGIGIRADGKIVLTGYGLNSATSTDVLLVRLRSDGSFDPTFDDDGYAMTDVYGQTDRAYDVEVVGSDLVVVGSTNNAHSREDFLVARYDNNGNLDSSFAGSGLVQLDIPTPSIEDRARDIVVQPDGKLLVVGDSLASTTTNAATDWVVVRYNVDGTLDSSFGSNGIVRTDVGYRDRANAVALDSDGRILVAGHSDSSGNSDLTVIRYLSDGAIDSSFGVGGIVTTDLGQTANEEAFDIAVQEDGGIVVLGQSNGDIAVIRYNSNGSFDSSFGTNGISITDLGRSNDTGHALAIQGDGKILAGGASSGSDGVTYASDFALARFQPDGSLDPSFGTNGIAIADFGGLATGIESIAIQSNGKIVAGGYNAFVLARFDADGSLDSSFDGDGMLRGQSGATVYALHVSAAGQIVAAGNVNSTASRRDMVVSVINSDGSSENDFASTGTARLDFGTSDDDFGTAMAIQADGAIVVAGYSDQSGNGTNQTGNNDFAIARLYGMPAPLTLSIVGVDDSATRGLIVRNEDDTFTYDPNGAFDTLADGQTAIDTFTYTVSDGNGGTDTATVTITIVGVNSPIDLNGTDQSGNRFATTFTEDGGPVLIQDLDLAVDGASMVTGPVGSEFQVNTFTSGRQELLGWTGGRAVATDHNGNFMIVWSSYQQDGSESGVYGQRYYADGTAAGEEFRVNSYTSNDQTYPSVAMDAVGNAVVVWTTTSQGSSGYSLYAQRYDATGAAVGGEFRLNSSTSWNQAYPSVAMTPTGEFVVAWSSYGRDGDNNGIFAQQFDASGVPVGSEFPVNTFTAGDQGLPSVAINDAGDFVVAWQSPDQDGSNFGVFARRFTAAGSPSGSEFGVNSFTNGRQAEPSVAMDSSGNFTIVWTSLDQDGSTYGIFGQRFDAAGLTVGSEFQVNSLADSHQLLPSIAMTPSGNAVVTWMSIQASNAYEVAAQQYDASGESVGSELRINSYRPGSQDNPSVAITPSSDFIVAWTSDGQDGSNKGVFAQRYAGDFVSTPNIDLATIAISNPIDGTQELLAVDTSGTNIVASYTNAALTLTGPASPATFQQVLRTATYENTSQNPSTADRLVEFSYTIGSVASEPSTTTVSVIAENDVPTIAASSSAVVVNEGDIAANTGSFGDVDDVSVSLSANVGTVIDQGNGTWSWSLPTQDGAGVTQSVIITATDGSNATAEVSFDLTVENVAPVLSNIELTPSIDENGIATITGVLTDPGWPDTHTVDVDWGDGTTETVSLANATAALTPVSDTVGRDDDLDGTYEFLENDALGEHKFELMPDRERRFAMEFDLFEFSTSDVIYTSILSLYRVGGTPAGLATIEVFGYSGDGAVSALDMNSVNMIAGPFTDSATDLASIDITSFLQSQIDAGATHAGIVLRSVVVERQTQLASSNNPDPALRPQLNIQFANRHEFVATHQYLDDPQSAGDIVNVSVTATDDDGGIVTETRQLIVANVAPMLDNLSLTTSMNSSGFVTFSGGFPGAILDPGTLDTHSVSIDFGDGSPPESIQFGTGLKSFTIPHQYSRVGVYAPVLTLLDDDGGSNSVSLDPVEIVAYVTTSAEANGNETGTVSGRFKIQQSVAADTDTLVSFSLTGTAMEGDDYAAIPHSATIVAGTKSTIVSIPVMEDTLEEGYETIALSLSSISSSDASVQLSASGQSASIGIIDNDPDDDTDGVSDPVENLAPNGGDGNSDGIPDSEQTYVTSLPNAIDGSYVTVAVAAPSGSPVATLTQVTTNPNPSPNNAPNVDFPNGFVDYQIDDVTPGGAVTVTLLFDSTETYTSYWKYGPTFSNTTPHWYEFLFDGTTGAVINGNEITLHFVDGGRGDDDLLANGTIVDPGAPSGPPPTNTGLPRASAGGPYYAAEGSQLTLDGSRSSHPLQDVESLTYEWDLDFANTTTFDVDATGIRPVISFADDFAPRKIALRVTDAEGNTHVGQTTLQVLNVAPVLEGLTVELVENSLVSTLVTTLAAFDPGSDSLAYSIVGGNEAGAFSVDATSGIITVSDAAPLDFESTQQFILMIEATDGDGGRGTAEVVVGLLNQASISGVVFIDLNENGSYEANEFGLDNVQVTLHDDAGNPVLDAHGEAISVLTSDGGFYLFDDLAPGSYQVGELQPEDVIDGTERLGSLGGSIIDNDIMQLNLARTDAHDYAFAEIGSQVSSGDSASIGFWQNKHGQALIAAGGNSLAQWLTTSFGNVFGNSLVGSSGQQVADFYREELFKQKSNGSTGPAKMDAQFMATAMSVYFTNRNLAGDVAIGYGFTVSQTGLGARAVNIGLSGEAFNAADNSSLTVMQLLLATNGMTNSAPHSELVGFASPYDLNGNGVIDSHERRLRLMAHQIYGTINQ